MPGFFNIPELIDTCEQIVTYEQEPKQSDPAIPLAELEGKTGQEVSKMLRKKLGTKMKAIQTDFDIVDEVVRARLLMYDRDKAIQIIVPISMMAEWHEGGKLKTIDLREILKSEERFSWKRKIKT